MTVDLVFFYGTEIVIVRLIDDNLYFAKYEGGIVKLASLEGLKFSETGILKEFPDLIDKPFAEMKRIAIERLKEKLRSMKTEKEKINYIKDDLEKYGYKLKIIKKEGWRPMTWEVYNANIGGEWNEKK